jgi:hypothetical protein
MKALMSRVLAVWCFLIVFTGQSLVAAPARVSANPVDEKVVKIYAYKMVPFVSMDEAMPGFLAELAAKVVEHPDLPVMVEVSPVAVLMKYSLIQAVGVAAIGMDKDFSPRDLQDLVSIPLYEKDGRIYKLYFNSLNPLGAQLHARAVENLGRAKADGTFETLLSKYNIK